MTTSDVKTDKDKCLDQGMFQVRVSFHWNAVGTILVGVPTTQ